MKEFEVDNFTAIIPGTCNANCGFCPEKESEQLDKLSWICNLIDNINRTCHMGYDHISLSGGEPTLDLRMLADTLGAIYLASSIQAVGFTTNGQFLETERKRLELIRILNSGTGPNVYFINISRHAFDTAENNEIMGVNYSHNLQDIAVFRQSLENVHSFRLNMVITPKTDYRKLFREAKMLTGWLRSNEIDIAFRCDYAFNTGANIPPEILTEFDRQFGASVPMGGCPTCISVGPGNPRYKGQIMLKSADFEPMGVDPIVRELIQHMNGKLYYDWTRTEEHDFQNDPALTKAWIGSIPPAIELIGSRSSYEPTNHQPRGTSHRIPTTNLDSVRFSSGRCNDGETNTGSCGGGCR